MEIRVGFTVTPGKEGWQFSPLQYLKIYETAEDANLDELKADLQDIMQYADNRLKRYKAPSKDDAIISALQAIASNQPKLK